MVRNTSKSFEIVHNLLKLATLRSCSTSRNFFSKDLTRGLDMSHFHLSDIYGNLTNPLLGHTYDLKNIFMPVQ